MLASFLCLDFPNIKPLLLHESRNSVRSMAYQMEGYCIRNPALLSRELETIHELTKGLEHQLDEPCPAKLKPTVQDILTCLDRCRAMVRSNGKQHAEPVQEIKSHVANTVASSPHAITNTPWSRGDGQNFRDMPKKRKIQTTHVQVCMHENFEGVPEDDYSWRKYGQKGILGTKSPRAYYRCRHRETQGCMAKKQVQRSEENPSIYNITYRGIHTCVEVPQLIQMPATIPEKQDPPQENMNSLSHQNSSDSQMHMNFTNSPTVQTENLNRQDFGTVSSFPCTPITYERAQNFHSSTSEDYHMSGMFSPFNSLMTSDFNLLPWPAPLIGSPRGATQSDLSELIPAATSTTSPPCVNSDFAWEWTNF